MAEPESRGHPDPNLCRLVRLERQTVTKTLGDPMGDGDWYDEEDTEEDCEGSCEDCSVNCEMDPDHAGSHLCYQCEWVRAGCPGP